MTEPEDITLGDRPLIVCDVDEVVLEFLTPFHAYLDTQGYRLLPRSFRLTGNIVAHDGGLEATREDVSRLQEDFFATQNNWQTPVDIAADALSRLSGEADIVFLTAMPPRHYAVRRALLNNHAMPWPMIATEGPKGPLVRQLHGERDQPVAFLDDIFKNLHSVRDHVPECLLINFIANDDFRALAPHPGDDIAQATSWREVENLISDHFRNTAPKA